MACTGNCNQGRNCTCAPQKTSAPERKKEPAMLIIYRLFRFYRRSGMNRTNALRRAFSVCKRDMQFRGHK